MDCRLILTGLLLSLALLTASCVGASSSSPAKTIPVAIQNYRFVPTMLTISVGDTVVWTNEDLDNHTVTSDTAAATVLDSGTLHKSGAFTRSFAKDGVFHYHCSFHPFMQGIIKVVSHVGG